jgi:hypothetical protein
MFSRFNKKYESVHTFFQGSQFRNKKIILDSRSTVYTELRLELE